MSIIPNLEYEIVAKSDVVELEESVRQMISEGWEPIGGVSVLRYELTNERKGYTDSVWQYTQAMIRRSVV